MKFVFSILAILVASFCSQISAENTVVVDNFDNNELGWTENSRPELGECVIMEGAFKFDGKAASGFYDYQRGIFTPDQVLLSEGVMPIDPNLGFTVSVDIRFDHLAKLFGGTWGGINLTSGFLLEYEDDLNYIAVACDETSCYVLNFKEGKLVRYKKSAIKMKTDDKNKVNANLKVEYKDNKLKICVDDIEMLEMRKIEIESPYIALFATGKRKVTFDNVVISQ